MKRRWVLFPILVAVVIGTMGAVNPIYSKLDQVKKSVKYKKYTQALYIMEHISNELRDQQQAELEVYFNEKIGGYVVDDQNYQLGEVIGPSDSLELLFARQYRSTNNSTIDVNVVYKDPAIREYQNIIQNPNLLNNLENTAVVRLIEKYDAFEKYSQEDGYYERNIILNDHALVNVVANGLEGREAADQFCDAINLSGLADYLSE